MSEHPNEIIKGVVSCACQFGDDVSEHLMMMIQTNDPNEPDWRIDAESWFKELFAEHVTDRFEIRFYDEEAPQ
jgi:hypothetical protein